MCGGTFLCHTFAKLVSDRFLRWLLFKSCAASRYGTPSQSRWNFTKDLLRWDNPSLVSHIPDISHTSMLRWDSFIPHILSSLAKKGCGQHSEPRGGSKCYGHQECSGWQCSRLVGWVAGCFVVWLLGCLAGWLVGWQCSRCHAGFCVRTFSISPYHQVRRLQCFWLRREDITKLWRWFVFQCGPVSWHLKFQVFKRFFDTNFLIENKFNQTILHMVLKAGYNNKVFSSKHTTIHVDWLVNCQILVHGDECGHVNEQTIYTLLSDNNMLVKHGMKSIINRVDSSGNTALHYAKHYPNQDIIKFMLRFS